MEENREQQVWQRVLARQEQEHLQDLQALLREAETLAALDRQLPGPVARKLREGEQANGECLRGISWLSGAHPEAVRIWQPSGKPDLRSCYRRTQHCRKEYLARTPDPEFGEVFRVMAEREAGQLALLAQLLGSRF